MHGLKLVAMATLVLAVAACSATNPTPSSLYDGHYVGTRRSDRTEACGITRLNGSTSARIARGQVNMDLFGPKTQLTGTVGEDGRVRASGMWTNPTGGFPGMTILNGTISDNELSGTASDFRCHTDVRLQRVAPPRRQPPGTRRTR
jgi:hypothetical protein